MRQNIETYLRNLQTSDTVRADAWDGPASRTVNHGDAVTTRSGALPLPELVAAVGGCQHE